MRYRNIAAIAVSTAVVASLAAACSSSSKSSGSGGGSGGGAAGGRGPITVVQGKDNSNTIPTLTQMWNKDHPNEKVTFKQQSDSADDQLQDLQQHFQAKDPNYDVVSVDVVWTAQFAAQGWIQPLKDSFAVDTSKLLPATVKAATYGGTLFAAPYASDGGMLYYRKDLVPTAPTTWDQMIADCSKKTAGMGCYAGQFANYEGLTVNAAEAINTAGGVFVKEDGKTPNVDTPEAKKGLDLLVNGFKQGYIPKEAISFKETESLNAFQTGKLLFMRQWPYGVAILNTAGNSVVKGKFGIAPLPGLTADKPGASSLGGHSFAMSVYGKHKATALDFMKFMESDPVQKYLLVQASNAPVNATLYTDPTLVAKAPYLPVLLKSIQSAVPRPVTPFYPAVTKAIQTNVYAALQGQKSSEQALKDLQAAINSAASGGG
jgi:multiple sugar transport system substrate-binding protein